MPELPEVETVRRDLLRNLPKNPTIVSAHSSFLALREPIAKKMPRILKGLRIQSIERRGKYLIFDLDPYLIVNHLGMSGTWRLEPSSRAPLTHDHLRLEFAEPLALSYYDPRRFGLLKLFKKNAKSSQEIFTKNFSKLGPEPFDTGQFHEVYLEKTLKGRKVNIKAALLDQKLVAGLGNIYVNEILFTAGVHPLTPARRLKASQLKLLVKAIRDILAQAIEGRGSTIHSFKSGEAGRFQSRHKVYGRQQLECAVCQRPILKDFISGRSTYWCPHCQPYRPPTRKRGLAANVSAN